MTTREMRLLLGDTQHEFARRYGIPFRTIQNWEAGDRTPPKYVLDMLQEKVNLDLINRKVFEYNDDLFKGLLLPLSSEYKTASRWLTAVADILGRDVVFALDDALMLEQMYLGKIEENLIYIYGNEELSKYRGVVVIGTSINEIDVAETSGIKHTSFNRTLNDSLANERILDMQGITEALSKYYFTHSESFEGLSLCPEYQDMFNTLADDAINYYSY